MKAPDKRYLNIPKQELEAPLDSTTWDTKEFDGCINIEYIRKDLVEHIIRVALGPQDALNKIRSL